MYLKNNKVFFLYLLILFFFSKASYSNEKIISDIVSYINNINNFSASFLQDDGYEIIEGNIAIGENRVRVNYENPSKIVIILDDDKAMYYNYDLDEESFFNPKNTIAWFFFDIFKNEEFFFDTKIKSEENNLVIEKSGTHKDEEYVLKIYFEDNPLTVRKINLALEENFLIVSFYNHNFNEEFSDTFFKLINPNFFN